MTIKSPYQTIGQILQDLKIAFKAATADPIIYESKIAPADLIEYLLKILQNNFGDTYKYEYETIYESIVCKKALSVYINVFDGLQSVLNIDNVFKIAAFLENIQTALAMRDTNTVNLRLALKHLDETTTYNYRYPSYELVTQRSLLMDICSEIATLENYQSLSNDNFRVFADCLLGPERVVDQDRKDLLFTYMAPTNTSTIILEQQSRTDQSGITIEEYDPLIQNVTSGSEEMELNVKKVKLTSAADEEEERLLQLAIKASLETLDKPQIAEPVPSNDVYKNVQISILQMALMGIDESECLSLMQLIQAYLVDADSKIASTKFYVSLREWVSKNSIIINFAGINNSENELSSGLLAEILKAVYDDYWKAISIQSSYDEDEEYVYSAQEDSGEEEHNNEDEHSNAHRFGA